MKSIYYSETETFKVIQYSTLYTLQPKEIDSQQVESLTSYISRLAVEHNLSTGTLINKILVLNMDKEYLLKSAKSGGNRFYDGAKSMNGYCKNALDFSTVLESLTLCTNLMDLTLMRLRNILSLRGLLKKHLSWCPNCIFDWKVKGNQIYYPLNWYLTSMKICLIHHTYLSNICPHCSKKIPVLHRSYINGYCPLCKGWLGKYQLVSNIPDINQVIFNSKNIGRLLTLDTTNLKNISQSLQSLIEEVTNGNITEFARLMSIPKVTVWDWVKGDRLPSLEGVLRICSRLELSIEHLLTNSAGTSNCKKEKSREKIFLQLNDSANKRREVDIELLNKKLEDYIQSNEVLSLSEVGKRIGYDRKLLYKYCPEQCKQIVENYKKYYQNQSVKRKKMLTSQVKVAVEELKKAGIYPSRRKVERYLEKSAVLREKYIQQVWKESIHS
ncbi:TniQ family protein [Bacillus cereus group sp. MYBK226-2]|uniref:TniQ family protein n=1 Tax=Bacillus cereus group sp. MYBK226-2 TaxID=3450655 RepID=UPI003F7B2277